MPHSSSNGSNLAVMPHLSSNGLMSELNSISSERGQIQVIFGPMFSGKTTELMRRLKRFQIAKYKCLVVKYAKDVRYDSSHLATHDQQTLPAVCATSLSQLTALTANYSIIGIDEGQFFPDTVEFAERMANSGKVVVVAALDGTYQREGFGNILQLVPLAESVLKLTAVCMRCYQDASYTMRTSAETAVEVIGGSDKYIAVCRACYHQGSPRPSPLKAISSNATDAKAVKTALFKGEPRADKENTPVSS